MSDDFNLHATSGPEGTRVEVTGELDAYTAPQLRSFVDELLGRGGTRVVVDLSQTLFVDSTGLGVLIGAARKCEARGGELSLDAPTPQVYRVLQMTGLSETLSVTNAPASSEGHEPPRGGRRPPG